jgi:hypothetical protein
MVDLECKGAELGGALGAVLAGALGARLTWKGALVFGSGAL